MAEPVCRVHGWWGLSVTLSWIRRPDPPCSVPLVPAQWAARRGGLTSLVTLRLSTLWLGLLWTLAPGEFSILTSAFCIRLELLEEGKVLVLHFIFTPGVSRRFTDYLAA